MPGSRSKRSTGRFEHTAPLRCEEHADFRRGARPPGHRARRGHRPRRGGHRQPGRGRPGAHDQLPLAVRSSRCAAAGPGHAGGGQRLHRAGMAVAAAGGARAAPGGGGTAARAQCGGCAGRGHRAGRVGPDPGRQRLGGAGHRGGHTNFAPRDERELAILAPCAAAVRPTSRSSGCCRARAWS